jgi:predicted hydrocarbon binding protein
MPEMIALTHASLRSLRAALLKDGSPQAAMALQEAGYAGGEALFNAFRRWLATRTDIAAEDLDVEAFEQRLSEFFEANGWGRLEIGTMEDAIATLDSSNWGESEHTAGTAHPSCYISTGIFADLFGRVAGAPVAVLEVECRSAGDPRCRFLVGSPAVMDELYAEIERGARYEEAVKQV